MRDRRPLNDKDERHGLWVWYHSNGKLMLKAHYVNDVPYGYLEYYPKYCGYEIYIDKEYYAR